MKLRRIGTIVAVVLGLAVLAALAPYWPCARCEASGRVHVVNGATMSPSDYREFRKVVTPKEERTEGCADCDGRGRCPGWRGLAHVFR